MLSENMNRNVNLNTFKDKNLTRSTVNSWLL